MAIEQSVSIGRRSEDRLMGAFTLEQVVTAGVCAGAGWGGCKLLGIGSELFSPAWWLVVGVMVAGLVAGVISTQRWEGQTPLERLLRRLHFRLRQLLKATVLLPPSADEARAGLGGSGGGMVVYYQGRPIARPYRPQEQIAEGSDGGFH